MVPLHCLYLEEMKPCLKLTGNKMIAKYKAIVLFLFLQTSVFSQDLGNVYFAGGCFWCMEESFEKKEGVLEVISGYSGGKNKKPHL